MLDMIKSAMGFGPSIDYSELKEKNVLVVDVRTKAEFQGGNYPKAKNIPLDQLSGKISELKKENRPIVTCCMSGARSGAAKRELEAAGIQEVYNGGNWASVAQAMEAV